ncbi:MAG: peptide-methionine (R)-S-oxide reductase MsrB [Candidatus Niyogibacteria bacterium]|nr:MAG: peptide-methionine (R)-S-oxide reductase MsrB [Candidatus Niyogibacteria bacterium]
MDENEIKNKLTPEQYNVMREKGTEAPFSGKLLHEKREGTFKCAACGNPLFSSDAKFDSGTGLPRIGGGWPSFDQALPGAVEFKKDDSGGMERVEVVCARCKSHLGHVFDDGPKETTGKRHCINSICLRFAPTPTFQSAKRKRSIEK